MRLPAKARRPAAASALAALAVAVPVGIAAAGGDAGRTGAPTVTVQVTAHHSRFSPATVDVAPGTTVRFVIRNLDPIDHEFIIGGPEVHERHEVGREAHHHGEVPGEISVPAGRTASTTWTAPVCGSAQVALPGTGSPDSFVYACHLPGHLAYGMAGVVRISG